SGGTCRCPWLSSVGSVNKTLTHAFEDAVKSRPNKEPIIYISAASSRRRKRARRHVLIRSEGDRDADASPQESGIGTKTGGSAARNGARHVRKTGCVPAAPWTTRRALSGRAWRCAGG